METDLQAKVEKYESKASKCREAAQQSTNASQRAMYEILAGYYGGLATDFRHAVEKRKIA